MKFKVTRRDTGEVSYLTGEELAKIPRAQARREAKQFHWPPIPTNLDRATAIKLIREALKKRSGKVWSVTGGRGTAYGWLHIDAPPARRVQDGQMTDAERAELGRLLGLDGPVHHQGESIPASSNHYREYIERARGLEPSVRGEQYWD